MILYLATRALVKLYAEEPGSADVKGFGKSLGRFHFTGGLRGNVPRLSPKALPGRSKRRGIQEYPRGI